MGDIEFRRPTDDEVRAIVKAARRARAEALAGLFRAVALKIKRARVAARTRRELADLDDAMLRDIGLTRMEIDRVAREQAWRAHPGPSAFPAVPARPAAAPRRVADDEAAEPVRLAA